ncbi:MAG: hydantoinase/oxoprolinase family protein, partial [Nevskiales bacterium]
MPLTKTSGKGSSFAGSYQSLGVDTGGTFTDFLWFDGQRLQVHKCLSTPAAPEQAILQGIAALAPPLDMLKVTHGSTVATNAVLEGKTARTAYVSNQGLADVLSIGRQARQELYNLQPQPQPPPVPQALCWEVGQRTTADGRQLQALTEADIQQLLARLESEQPEAIAINLLFSFLDDSAEKAIEAALPDDVFVSRSSAILPELREYERGMATWLNAAVGPVVGRYLSRLKTELPVASLAVMHSAAGTVDIGQASQHGVRLLLSGPAGGLLAARYMGRLAGEERLLTFDMGGTSTDVALIDGEIQLTSEGRIAGWPVAVPMVAMHTIGAGGGSIARLDAGGLLQVGPESAGADPGPACYGQGGQAVTVTDANLVLGRLPATTALGGDMLLDVAAAKQAMAQLAASMGMSVEAAALGVLRIANEHMAQALRVISVERGEDPRDYSLMSFGGAGGLQVCALADALGMRRAIVPVYAGVLSALGMLVARPSRQLSQSLLKPLDAIDEQAIQQGFECLGAQGQAELLAEAVATAELKMIPSVDLRYAGQDACLNLAFENLAGLEA